MLIWGRVTVDQGLQTSLECRTLSNTLEPSKGVWICRTDSLPASRNFSGAQAGCALPVVYDSNDRGSGNSTANAEMASTIRH